MPWVVIYEKILIYLRMVQINKHQGENSARTIAATR